MCMCVTAWGDLLAEQCKLDFFCLIELFYGLFVANQILARKTFFKNENCCTFVYGINLDISLENPSQSLLKRSLYANIFELSVVSAIQFFIHL